MKITDKIVGKNISFKNRIVMPPMATGKSDENGHVTEEILNYYNEKTADKVFSAVIVEHSFVDKMGMAHKNQTSIADDSCIKGMSNLAQTIQKNNALAILQISHAGGAAKKSVISAQPVAPSAVKNPARESEDTPRELSVYEIESIVEKFVDAVERAKKAGFDGVEIHSAHGYLLDQFLSPITNKRTDDYGGNIQCRIKIHLDIIKGIRNRLGNDYPIFLRMGAGDFMEGGLTEEDAVYAAKEFEKAGIDVIDISGGLCFYTIDDKRAGYFDVISKPIYENVQIPVILTGGVQKGQDVEDILNRNVCSLVGIGRAVFKDSAWIKNEILPII